MSLAKQLTDQTDVGDRFLVWNGVAMRDGAWKLITKPGGKIQGPVLYDLATDLGEKNDVANEHRQRVVNMVAVLGDWRKDVAATATHQPSPPEQK